MESTCKYTPDSAMLNLVSYPLNNIIPEFERTCRDFGLKYFLFLPIETYFRVEKNFFMRLLRKFKERIACACLVEYNAAKSMTLNGVITNE